MTALKGLLVLASLGIVCGLQLSAASGADSPSNLLGRADALRSENGQLDRQAQAAWLSAASLDTRLEHTRAALSRLRARTAAIASQRAEAELQLAIARRGLKIAQHRLAMRVRALYEEDETDPMTVLLGAKSIGEAIERLDGLDRVAVQDEHYVEAARAARRKLLALTRVLAGREAAARRAQDAAAATAAALETAVRERRALVAQLQAQQRENSVQASSLDSEARTLAAAQQAAASAARAAPVAGGKTFSVTATGYSLQGRTATGVSVAWGVVAVDPSVIPLGTRMSIPGYGEGIAADTGGAVVGARIDLWFPTEAEALAWGTRSVTITLR
ncbi:MAG TPA: 3D domain-containing protein [Gaiellaceae bacterium]|nr:3D domain-containing protein [Gaiellaceae bacterium]